MKRSNKGFDYCYNAQAVVDGEREIIVAAVGLDPHFAVGRQKHHAPATEGPAATETSATTSSTSAAVADENPKSAMARKLRTPSGKTPYAARKHIAEPAFGQIKYVRGFRRFLLRGLTLVSAEWKLICLTHNLLKICRHVASVS